MKPKKKEISSKPSLTYHLGRVCENKDCREPIADQERKSKKHCSEYTDENGIHHNCRRRKHQQKHQIHEDQLLDYAAIQRQTKAKIEEAIITHGEFVTEAVLAKVINITTTLSQIVTYNIIVNPFKQSIKIQKHD